MRALLRWFPKRWRERCGPEIDDDLSRRCRMPTIRRITRTSAAALAACGLATAARATSQLDRGLVELPEHW